MRKSRILPLFLSLCVLLSGELARAQRQTNTAELTRASHDFAQKEKDLHIRLLNLAQQKHWPLILHDKRGRKAYLMGLDPGGFPIYTTTADNLISAATIGTSQLWPGGTTGLALNGSSAALKSKIAVWDEAAVRLTHVELTGRVVQEDGDVSLSDHSTHVAGTMIAAGINPAAKGMANGAQQLLAYDFTNDVSEMFGQAPNLLISNHSYAAIAGWYFNSDENRWEFWGSPGDTVDYKFGDYDAETQLWDSIAYNAPHYLIVKAGGNNRNQNGPAVGQPYFRYDNNMNMVSAGARPAGISSNDGYDIIATYGTAKNILTMGAVNPIPGGYSQPSDVVQSSFSSWGPTADGRIKPDLVADGVDVLSSISTADNAYDIYSGTSMASPAAAGSAFLLQEYYAKLHSGNFMLSSTLKGLLIHTADEAGPSPGPDYQNGWGLIDMPKAASVITSDHAALRDQMIEENTLVNGSHDADNIPVVASGKTPLVATIAWIDPPAASNNTIHVDTSRKLVNDLDLRITDGVSTWKPWVLNPANPGAAATTGDNFRDNVEKVEVDSVVPGRSYTLTVTHKGTLARAGSQTYSLIISGIGGTAYCPSASLGAGTHIDQVVLSNINNTISSPSCRTYSDYTSLPAARLPAGQTVPISITYNTCTSPTTTNIAVYIDYNNDGNFTDAGELVSQNTNLLSSTAANAIFNGNINVPASVTPGAIARMRIIAEDNGSLATPGSCDNNYAGGETQDYRVEFVNPSNDVGITQLEYPILTSCANDSQLVAVRIKNFGNTVQTSVPVTTTVTSGATTVATFNGTCKDSIQPGAEVVFTYGTTFAMQAGANYTFTSTTNLAGDLDADNNENVTSLTVNAATASPTGTATVCSTGSNTQVSLQANASEDDIGFWYTTATGGTPLAAGNSTTTNVLPANKTYYLGLNDLSENKVGPVTNTALSSGAGAYFGLSGNYINITTSVPLTIESARLYIGYPGKINFTLGTLLTSSFANGYNYQSLYSTTIDVAASVSNPQPGTQNVSSPGNGDPGAIYYLNIPIPNPGNYILIVNCEDNATAFLNVNNSALPYPFSLPGVFSITGTYINDSNPGDSTTFPKEVYFPFYDLGVRLEGCASPRVPIVASTPTAPTIQLNGSVLVSSIDSGNQWYIGGQPIPGAINPIDTPQYSGYYMTVVDEGGCQLSSNTINFDTTSVNGSPIGLKITTNPNHGVFELTFYMSTQADMSVSLVDMLGQQVYQSVYPAFSGQFARTISVPSLASGIYVLRIVHGKDVYTAKVLIAK